jgi:dienelactone hydrolase
MAPELPGFTHSTFSHGGKTRDIYRAGAGPGVIVIHEMPGITPQVAAFGNTVADAGFTAVLPSLFGKPGKPLSAFYALREMAGGCISREFVTFATNKTSPVTAWLRALARQVHGECGGPGVGVVGMCFTGGFALGMMAEPAVVAPALSQPSLPFPIGKKRAAATGVSDADLAIAKQRCAAENICVMGMRFTNDAFVRAARFETLKRELGENFIAVEIDSSPGNPHGIPRSAHSVLTVHLVDEPGHPTREALEGLLRFFGERLKPAPASQ